MMSKVAKMTGHETCRTRLIAVFSRDNRSRKSRFSDTFVTFSLFGKQESSTGTLGKSIGLSTVLRGPASRRQ